MQHSDGSAADSSPPAQGQYITTAILDPPEDSKTVRDSNDGYQWVAWGGGPGYLLCAASDTRLDFFCLRQFFLNDAVAFTHAANAAAAAQQQNPHLRLLTTTAGTTEPRVPIPLVLWPRVATHRLTHGLLGLDWTQDTTGVLLSDEEHNVTMLNVDVKGVDSVHVAKVCVITLIPYTTQSSDHWLWGCLSFHYATVSQLAYRFIKDVCIRVWPCVCVYGCVCRVVCQRSTYQLPGQRAATQHSPWPPQAGHQAPHPPQPTPSSPQGVRQHSTVCSYGGPDPYKSTRPPPQLPPHPHPRQPSCKQPRKRQRRQPAVARSLPPQLRRQPRQLHQPSRHLSLLVRSGIQLGMR